MKITLKDKSIREYDSPMKAIDIISDISAALARATLCVGVDGETHENSYLIDKDCALCAYTFDDEEGRHAYRHTASHVMAQAVLSLFPEAKTAIGPAIDNGFYYDFDVERPFTAEDFPAIEAKMHEIIKANYPLVRSEMPRDEAIVFMQSKGQPYKVQLIRDLPEDAIISFYTQGDYVDLCAGPHLSSTGVIKAFKLMSVAGAYWRGDEKNKMLSRIYGTAFSKKAELDEYITRMEEAKKRDHRKLGRELDLYSLLDEGPGFPFFHPKGMVLRNILEDFWRKEHTKRGYEEIKTPIMLRKELWERSGHWDHYKENMYTTTIDEEEFAIKPMNCPGGMLMYMRQPHSYKDLPIRCGELGLVHRHELSGTLHGLMRVRCFTQDDAHIFMTPEQITDEILGVMELVDYVYGVFGFKYKIELSTKPENSIGTDEQWEIATNGLKRALDTKGLPYAVNEGDGAFYGPKIDFHIEDCIGRTWQCGTIQLDMQLPERFDLTYVGADGEKHRPVMVHRVIFGSIERFIGILTEHFAGAFPLWIAPVQVRLLTVTDRAGDYAAELKQLLMDNDIRVETDTRNEKIGFKVREARLMKIPYLVVLGDKETESGEVAVRQRGSEATQSMSKEAFIEKLKKETAEKMIF